MDYEELKAKLDAGELPQLRKLTLLQDRILVLPEKNKKVSNLGIEIIGSSKTDRGTVVRAGAGFWDSPMGTKEGDLVVYAGLNGITKEIDGVPLKLMRDFEILAVIL
jgi:co-chaperonin GroES (HSP10)